jgi:hypothetical protein
MILANEGSGSSGEWNIEARRALSDVSRHDAGFVLRAQPGFHFARGLAGALDRRAFGHLHSH